MAKDDWTFEQIPDQSGRTAVVTGANSGIGFETARRLAQRGANVVLACRDLGKGQRAIERILRDAPQAKVTLQHLDLSDLDVVASFAAKFATGEGAPGSSSNARGPQTQLDLLVNNAGVMVPPLGRTKQGFELQFGTNHLGHFALTGHLLPHLSRTAGARVVVVSSTAQRVGRINFEDINWEHRSYSAWAAYGQSKLANMMFALELHRRLLNAGSSVRVTAAHPGWTATDLQRTSGLARFFNPMMAMKPEDGALPTLRAATDPSAQSGSYWGPAHMFELHGPPVSAQIPGQAKNEAVARQLWEASEKLTGVTFSFGPAGGASTSPTAPAQRVS